MAVFKCKMCGGALEVNNETVAVCEYCGTKQTLPRLNDERKANLYDRANHFRRNNEFDKAAGIYEKILTDDLTDAEAYWSLVLCRFGIEYVEDPSSHKRIPTINRAQYTSIFDDDNYKSALQYADLGQKELYENEAKAINEIQKGILAISQKEEPFDVFICYKETDNNGRRTPDSVLATDLYHLLTQEGFKVFFSRITLEDKLGSAYEPYIFAALNSAKIMVVLGTKPEYFNAVWVKNEWSRYLALIKNGANKMLIPAYKDMDPYDLPEEFSHLQAQDMSKLGFMQDLIRGIKKIIGDSEPKQTVIKETVISNDGLTANVSALLKRGFMALEDGEWVKADDFFEQALNQNAELAEAYLGKLMADLKAKKRENLKDATATFENNINYQKVIRFGDEALEKELKDYIDYIIDRNRNALYNEALNILKSAQNEQDCYEASAKFNALGDFKDSKELTKECTAKAEVMYKDEIYNSACHLMSNNTLIGYELAIDNFEKIPDWRDSKERIEKCKAIVEKVKLEKEQEMLLKKKKNKIAVSLILILLVVIFILTSFNFNRPDIVAISAGSHHTVGLKSDGTVVAVGSNISGQCNVSDWTDIVAISVGEAHTVGLKKDGTVVAVGSNISGQCNVSDWTDIVAISAGGLHTVGLKKDGTVVAVGDNDSSQCDVSYWTDIIAISAGGYHTVGLKKDGTVVAVGWNAFGQCDVSNWTDIVAISAGVYHTVGLKKDGTVVAVGDKDDWQCDVDDWTDIVAISAGYQHTVVLKKDGTVVAVGKNYDGQCDVSDWTDIVAISAGYYHTVGLKKDGTVVAVGYNGLEQCNVSGFVPDVWKGFFGIS